MVHKILHISWNRWNMSIRYLLFYLSIPVTTVSRPSFRTFLHLWSGILCTVHFYNVQVWPSNPLVTLFCNPLRSLGYTVSSPNHMQLGQSSLCSVQPLCLKSKYILLKIFFGLRRQWIELKYTVIYIRDVVAHRWHIRLLGQMSRVRILHLPQYSWCVTGSLCNNVNNLKGLRGTYPWGKQDLIKDLKF